MSFVANYLHAHGITTIDDDTENVGYCCPFHNDTEPSARFHRDKEIWQCFACSIGGNIAEFEAKLRGCSKDVAEKFVGLYRGTSPTVPDTEVEQRHAELMSREDLLARLLHDRGISKDLVVRYKLGWESDGFGRLWIPIQFGEFTVNVKRWDVFYRDSEGEEFKKRKNRKVLPYKKGFSMEHLFPYDQLSSKNILVTEGEGDCLTALRLGLPAITVGSAQSDITNHIDLLAGKTLYLCYDVDDAGRKGCKLTAERLLRSGFKVKIVDLSKMGAEEGQDLTDLVLAHGLTFEDFDEVISKLPFYVGDEEEGEVEQAHDEVPDVSKAEEIDFGQYVLEKYHHSAVSMSSVLIGQDEVCKRIPHRLKMQCLKRGQKKCHFCPLNEDKSGWVVDLGKNTEKALGFYYGNEQSERELIKNYFGLLCDGFEHVCIDKQNLTKVVLIPNTSFKVSSKVSLAYGFTTNVFCEFNHSYQVVAKVVTNPRNNDINLLIWSFENSAAFAVKITPQFLEEHKVFQIEGG